MCIILSWDFTFFQSIGFLSLTWWSMIFQRQITSYAIISSGSFTEIFFPSTFKIIWNTEWGLPESDTSSITHEQQQQWLISVDCTHSWTGSTWKLEHPGASRFTRKCVLLSLRCVAPKQKNKLFCASIWRKGHWKGCTVQTDDSATSTVIQHCINAPKYRPGVVLDFISIGNRK